MTSPTRVNRLAANINGRVMAILKTPKGAAKAPSFIINHMRQAGHLKDIHIQLASLQCLKDLASSDANKQTLVSSGVIEQSLIALKFHGKSVEITKIVMELFYYLAFEISDEIAEKSEEKMLLLNHLLNYSAKSVVLHKSSVDVIGPAISFLYALSLNEEWIGSICGGVNGEHLCIFMGHEVEIEERIELCGLLHALLQMQCVVSSDQAIFLVGRLEDTKDKLQPIGEDATDAINSAQSCIKLLRKCIPPEHSKVQQLERTLAQLQTLNLTLVETVEELKEGLLMAKEDEETKLCRFEHRLEKHYHQFHRYHGSTRKTPGRSSPTSGRLSPGASWSKTIASKRVMAALRELDEESGDSAQFMVTSASSAIGLAFINLEGDANTAVPKGKLRKFLVKIGVFSQLSEADLAIRRANGTKGGVGFESFCDLLVRVGASTGSGGIAALIDALEKGNRGTNKNKLGANVLASPLPPPSAEDQENAMLENSAHDFYTAVLETESAALKKIFSYYAVEKEEDAENVGARRVGGSVVMEIPAPKNLVNNSPRRSTHTTQRLPNSPGRTPRKSTVTFVTYKKLLFFVRDFCLAPDLVSKSFCLSSFKDIINQVEGINGEPLVDISDVVHAEQSIGLGFDGFLSFLAYIAGECKWFARRKEKKKDSDKKIQHQQVLALLQWLDTSPGKSKINRIRGTAIIPAFKFTSNVENYTQISQFLM
ncbi:hypothetical protein TrLO_g14895 [Triparma laevis f. longispina]|uniref:Uncharacterized protein n=1 Tax=Triparma laevis f. longispina TaxID=1714387 RepID=A0A9W7L0Y4_9STRA|nr:hypothetical protein TrLO_g14895 [Triparma laevis f. longispina]